MNTLQIIKFMLSDKYTKKDFLGVFPRDKLPNNFLTSSCFIFNTHKSNQPGEHWLAFFIDKKRNVEFFDPIGLHPNLYGLDKYIKKKFQKKIIFSNKRIQGYQSNYCGIYCIYFLFRRCRGDSFKKIINSLGSFVENDNYIKSKLN